MTRTIILAAALLSGAAFAQEQPELLVSGEVEHGGYGGPEMRVGSVRGEGAVFVGGRGGWLIDHTFVLGFGGYGLASRIGAPDAAQLGGGRFDINFGYGGPFIEAIVLPRRVWHISIASMFAGGGVSYGERDTANTAVSGTSAVFVWEPSVTLEINVLKFMRIDLGGSWRVVRGVDLDGLRNSDLAGPSALLAFKFGKF